MEWISVEDRLPKQEEWVILQLKKNSHKEKPPALIGKRSKLYEKTLEKKCWIVVI